MRILLAEDEKSLSRVLVAIFKKNNYSVDAVFNGNDALFYIESGNYDVAVLDIMMPGMDGITVLKKVRAEGIDLPIIMLTAKAEVDDLEKKIKENRGVVAGFKVSALTADEYKLYLAIVREMDFVDHYWSQNFEQFLAAKQAVLPQAAIDQYEDSVLMAEIEEMRAQRNLEIAKRGVPTEVGGTIIERLVDAGATVEAGEALFVIQPDRGYKATMMISKYDIGLIEEGQKATIAYAGETYEGVVESIAAVAEPDASGKPKVKVTVVFSDKEFKPIIGLEAEVSIQTGAKDGALVVDSKGVYTDDEGDYVYVLNNGQVERKNIKVGLKGNGKAEILSGLNEGEEVITSPITEEEIGTRKSAR